jgi:Inhibitor of Apoptosis domain/Zinc finger, C3HC4 type (RING finger)
MFSEQSPLIYHPVLIQERIPDTPDVTEFFRKMKNGKERLGSFRIGNWPLAFMNPKPLAEAGFFYLCNRDRVQCAFCRVVVCGFAPGDDPLEEHQRHFPRCPFLMAYDVGNIPIERDPFRTPGHDVCGNHTFDRPVPNGILDHVGPKNLEFVSAYSRSLSYTSEWPKDTPVQIKDLVAAGLYYFGKEDYVKCFYCDGGLRGWNIGEDPWVEHGRLWPQCLYVRLNKGDTFIESCKKEDQRPIDEDDVVNKWLCSDIVIQLEDLYHETPVPTNIVKTILYNRWLEKKKPFENVSELYDAISAYNSTESCVESPVLYEENKRLVCIICLDKEIGTVFVPCGHFVTCTVCAPGISKCPMCRSDIKSFVRTFLA